MKKELSGAIIAVAVILGNEIRTKILISGLFSGIVGLIIGLITYKKI